MKRPLFIPLLVLALLLQVLAAYGTHASCFAMSTYQNLVAHEEQSSSGAGVGEECEETEEYTEEYEETEKHEKTEGSGQPRSPTSLSRAVPSGRESH